MKKMTCLLLALILCVSLLPRAAAVGIDHAPYPEVNYNYSLAVSPGTIRYVCQLPASSQFYAAYWPEEPFGDYKGAASECSTACISMALSYTGINVLPKEILEAHGGTTFFRRNWGGAEFTAFSDKSDPVISGSHVTEALDRYIDGNSSFAWSPPIIHIPGYSTKGHYVLVIGREAPGVYRVLDPGNSARSIWTITISGLDASYNHPKTGAAISDKIDGVFQYRNPNASPEQNYIYGACTRYPAGISLEFIRDTVPCTLPCSAGTAMEYGCTSEPLEDQRFSAGTFGYAEGLYRNTEGEYWYQVKLADGTAAYVDSAQANAWFIGVPRIEDGSFPSCISGPTNLRGEIDAQGAQIQYVRAYVYPEDSDTPVLMSDLVPVGDTRYALYQSAVDASLFFGDLEVYGPAAYRLDIVADLMSCYAENGELRKTYEQGVVVDSYSFSFGWPEHSPIEPPDTGHSPVEIPGGFGDIDPDAYYYDAVLWAVEQQITNGTAPGVFSPGDDCLRAQVVTFLWRAEGCPEPESRENPFRDVSRGAYYYEAVLWALEEGITTGVSADRFGPDEPCTREQVVTFLYRTMGEPRVRNTACPFTDVQSGTWYEKPVLWAVQNGITNGISADTFGVGDICTRAQIVTFLYRTYEA